MHTLQLLILLGGVLHFGILAASALVPKVLNWRASLAGLDRLSRQLIWVHGVFIVLVIVGLGLVSVFYAGDLAGGSPLARGVCVFIAVFWGMRLFVQFFVFDAKPFLTTRLLRTGYHGLTCVFAYQVCVFSVAAFHFAP
jgi:hypothetical protein